MGINDLGCYDQCVNKIERGYLDESKEKEKLDR